MQKLPSHELQLCQQVRTMCACNQLRRAARGMTQLYDEAMASSGLKVTQLPILVGLGSSGDLSLSALATTLALDRTTLTRNVRVLEERCLVRSFAREDDARVRMVSLTPQGRQVLSEALAHWEDVQLVVEAQFGAPRLRSLYDELAALTESVGG